MCVYLNCSLGVRDWIREIIKYCASLQRQVGTQQRLRLREFGIVRQLLTGPRWLIEYTTELGDDGACPQQCGKCPDRDGVDEYRCKGCDRLKGWETTSVLWGRGRPVSSQQGAEDGIYLYWTQAGSLSSQIGWMSWEQEDRPEISQKMDTFLLIGPHYIPYQIK